MTAATTFRTDIQGLRAAAVVPVVLYHVDPRLAPGGFVGVDVFFVISGFLITQILLREIEQGTFSIRAFYERRVRRLFPALYAMLAATLFAGVFILSPADLHELGRTTLGATLFAANLVFLNLSGYFDGAAELKPLLHTWSLAVEEQFYLLFPLALVFVARRAPRLLKAALWLAALASFGACLFLIRNHQAAAFYLPATRAYELLLGALVAAGAVPALRRAAMRHAASLVGLAMIGASVVLFNKSMVFPGWAALAPAIGCALVIHAGQGGDAPIGSRVLSFAPFVAIGAISYSLYLWHWPVLTYARYLAHGEPPFWTMALAGAASVALAAVSWRWIEQPLLRRPATCCALFGGAGAAMAASCAVAGMLVFTHGLPHRFPTDIQTLFAGAWDSSPHRARCHNDHEMGIAYERNCVFGASGAEPSIAVWGDSFGAELAVALGEAAAGQGRATLQATASACPPALGYKLEFRPKCAAHNEATLARLAADARIETVVLVANYERYEHDTKGLLDGLARTADKLRDAGKTIVLTYPIPTMPNEAPRTLGLIAARGGDISAYGAARAEYAKRMAGVVGKLDEIAARVGGRRFMPDALLCEDEWCPGYRADAGVLYFDSAHLSLTGARLVVGGEKGLMAMAR